MSADGDKVARFPSKALLEMAASSHALRDAEAASRAARERWQRLLFRLSELEATQDPTEWEAAEAAARHERMMADCRVTELRRAPAQRHRLANGLERELTAKLDAVRLALRSAADRIT